MSSKYESYRFVKRGAVNFGLTVIGAFFAVLFWTISHALGDHSPILGLVVLYSSFLFIGPPIFIVSLLDLVWLCELPVWVVYKLLRIKDYPLEPDGPFAKSNSSDEETKVER